MTRVKKLFSFSNKRQIWRLIPADSDRMIVEERDIKSREVFFNCLRISDGKIIFKNFQLDEKYWLGIETIYKNIIFFHKFASPGMPVHMGIIAFEISSKKIIWQTGDYSFLFIKDNKIYAYRTKFEGKEFFTLNYITGEKLEEFGDNSKEVNSLREEQLNQNYLEGYLFPQPASLSIKGKIKILTEELRKTRVFAGEVSCIELNDIILFNFHEVLSDGNLRNTFRIIEIDSKKIILEEILDRETKLFIPDSFFVKDRLVFIIKEKVKLIVYSF